MAVFSAFRRALGALRRNPVLFVPAAVYLLFQLSSVAAQAVSPIVSVVLSMLFSVVALVVVPFFLAGTVAMGNEALDGRSSLGTFLRAGKAYYVPVLVAYAVLFAVNLLLGGAVFVALFVVGLVVLVDGAGLSVVALAVLAFVGLVFFLGYALLYTFVQFFPQAAVVDGRSGVESLKRSVGVVRRNVLSTLGYTILVLAVVGVPSALFGLASALLSPERNPFFADVAVLGPAVALAIGSVLFLFGFGFYGVYSVAFYRAISA